MDADSKKTARVNRRKTSILIIDDDESFSYAFQKIFSDPSFRVLSAENGSDGLRMIESEKPDLVFMDISMPIMTGIDVLEAMKERNVVTPVIVMTGNSTMDTAIKATQLGAYEYITKPVDVNRVRVITSRALETSKLRREVLSLRSEQHGRGDRFEIVGSSRPMQELFKLIGTITTTTNSTNVLILGGSGTGKELIARAIHSRGSNAKEPFIAINCTALPETLLESELFGHERGAFTGAERRKTGKFEIAGRGTIFLDEIGDMPFLLQQKLLRVIQEREFEPLGSNNTHSIEARFIAATNKDLSTEVENGRFREDLYYRLNVFTLSAPSLSEHIEDVPELIQHFLARYNRQLGRNIVGVEEEVMTLLMNYEYPGNVRELDNLIERCVIMTRGALIQKNSLPMEMRIDLAVKKDISNASLILEEARSMALETTEIRVLTETLRQARGNVTQAARRTKIPRESFHRLLKKYDIDASSFRTDDV